MHWHLIEDSMNLVSLMVRTAAISSSLGRETVFKGDTLVFDINNEVVSFCMK